MASQSLVVVGARVALALARHVGVESALVNVDADIGVLGRGGAVADDDLVVGVLGALADGAAERASPLISIVSLTGPGWVTGVAQVRSKSEMTVAVRCPPTCTWASRCRSRRQRRSPPLRC
jgi:hypothetical protein